jgi:hypothetical protein
MVRIPYVKKIWPVAALAKIATNLLARLSVKDDTKKLNKKCTRAYTGETTFCSSFLPVKFFSQFLLLQEALNMYKRFLSLHTLQCCTSVYSRPRKLHSLQMLNYNYQEIMCALFSGCFESGLWTERENNNICIWVLKSDWNSKPAVQWNKRGH